MRVSIVVVTILTCVWVFPAIAQKKTLSTGDELPRLTYKIEGSATELVTDAAKFAPFARQVRADVERVRAEHAIEDNAALKQLKRALLYLELLDGHDDAALQHIGELRDLTTNPASLFRLELGFHEARLRARKQIENPDRHRAAVKRAFRALYSAQLQELPWPVMQRTVKLHKSEQDTTFENRLLAELQWAVAPSLAKSSSLGLDEAIEVITKRMQIQIELPFKAERLAVLHSVIASHRETEKNIWTERAWQLSPGPALTPVVVAIWDTGVDMTLFKRQRFVNQGEKLNGQDDDQNAFIDDLHGIGYDVGLNKDSNPLPALGDTRERRSFLRRFGKGWLDNGAGVESQEVRTMRKYFSKISPDELGRLYDDMTAFKAYASGTQVAGLVVQGNPAIRLLSARMSWDERPVPISPTLARARRAVQIYREIVEYFKVNRVRVVNMSWGETEGGFERQLVASGSEPDAAKRAALAREIFQIHRAGLLAALESAPDLLFVCPAMGGVDGYQGMVPSSFQLPNLLGVGAVDQCGNSDWFTSVPEDTKVYANAAELETVIPGGDHVRTSAHFKAASNVSNLAAKLLAVKPALRPEELIELIQRGAEKGGSNNLPLIHPRKTGELVNR